MSAVLPFGNVTLGLGSLSTCLRGFNVSKFGDLVKRRPLEI